MPDLAATVQDQRASDASFGNEIVVGVAGKQILADDPPGNPVELFEPTIGAARLAHSTRAAYAPTPAV